LAEHGASNARKVLQTPGAVNIGNRFETYLDRYYKHPERKKAVDSKSVVTTLFYLLF
jgi:hypothetical protein